MAYTFSHNFDSSVNRTGYILGTEYTLPYLSRSTGVPPTLLALKQHAQSLAYLISMLQPHGGDHEARRKTDVSDSDVTDGSLLREPVSNTDDATTDNPFDWLDLDWVYTNDADPGHYRPLMDLINEVQSRHDALDEITYHCPLTTYKPRNGGPCCYYRTDIYGAPPIHGPIYVCPVSAPQDLSSVLDADGRGSAAAASVADKFVATNIDHMKMMPTSALEQRYDRRLREAGRIARTNKHLAEKALQQTQALLVLRQDHKRMQASYAELQRSTDEIWRRMQTAEAELQKEKARVKTPAAPKRAD
ncbi:hypothetical protein Sste5346_008966 [Sporothrix stenoceras]|uniref:Uncharacterized protein n=1 Tax=Sporothrix stenoceras TaxID=5173 RepID=A0ABR3YLT2_9PEZI